MINRPELPPGWAMPYDQAKNIRETLNKKPVSPVDELEKALKDIARDVAILEPNTLDWEGWLSLLWRN